MSPRKNPRSSKADASIAEGRGSETARRERDRGYWQGIVQFLWKHGPNLRIINDCP
jgi:hypothetical protein